MTHFRTLAVGVALAMGLLLQACYTNPPPGTISQSHAEKFEASWQAARWGAADVGVRVSHEDRATGTLTGTKGPSYVIITVTPESDGSIRVAISVTGPKPEESADLKNRVTEAYERRMGR